MPKGWSLWLIGLLKDTDFCTLLSHGVCVPTAPLDKHSKRCGGFLTLHCSLLQSYHFLSTVVDDVVLPKDPKEILAEKNFNTVPYIVGINKQECGWLLPTVSMNKSLWQMLIPWRTAIIPLLCALMNSDLKPCLVSGTAVPTAVEYSSKETFSGVAQLRRTGLGTLY